MAVFMAGATSFGHFAARRTVVSISSARPWAAFAMKSAVAGATQIKSAAFAKEMCSTSYLKFRSKVSTETRLLVRVSKVRGAMNRVAFSVMMTCTSACCFFKALASMALLYAAMPPVMPSSTVFPCSIVNFLSVIDLAEGCIPNCRNMLKNKPFFTNIL